MLQYFINYPNKILNPLIKHIELTLVTLVLSVLIAAILTIWSMRFKRLGNILLSLFSVAYSIPSLALFALLIPITGLGRTSAVIALVFYNQYLLLGNFLAGLNQVEPSVVEAARGIGLTSMQVLWKVQIPLAKASLYAGIRLAVVSTIGIGTIAASINAGGIGVLLFEGLRTMNVVKILWGSLLSAALAITMNGILKAIEQRSVK